MLFRRGGDRHLGSMSTGDILDRRKRSAAGGRLALCSTRRRWWHCAVFFQLVRRRTRQLGRRGLCGARPSPGMEMLERHRLQRRTWLRVRKGRCHRSYVRAVPCRQVQGTDGIVCVHAVRGGKELGGVGRDVVQHLLRMRGGEGRTGSRGERLCRVCPWIHSGVVTSVLLIKTVHFNDFEGAVV